MNRTSTFSNRPAWYRVVIAGAIVITLAMIASVAIQVSDLISWRTWSKVETFENLTELREINVEVGDEVTLVVDKKATNVTVKINARAGLSEPKYAARFSASRLTVSGNCDRFGFGGSTVCNASTEITLPSDLDLDLVRINSDMGRITVGDINAATLEAHTDLGHISVANIVGNVKATSDTGKVTAKNIDGNLESHSGTGWVMAHNISGTATATTNLGQATVWNVAGDAKASSDTGNVYVCEARSNVEAVSSNGEVVVLSPLDGEPVNLNQSTSLGTTKISAPTNPQSKISVTIHSSLGAVTYEQYDGQGCGGYDAD